MTDTRIMTLNNNNVATIDSREVAEMLEVEHKLVLRKLDGTKDGKTKGIIPILRENNFVLSDYFIESSYKIEGNNKTYKCYLLTRLGCDFIANKFTGEKGILFTAKYVKRFSEMEKKLKEVQLDSYMIEDPVKRAEKWIEEQKERQALAEKVEEQEKEISHKKDVIVGLVEDIGLAEKRQRITQIIRRGHTNYQLRYNILYNEFEKKYHVDITKRLNNAKSRGEVKKSMNKMGYICEVMNMTSNLYELCCKLFENDFNKLFEEFKNGVA